MSETPGTYEGRQAPLTLQVMRHDWNKLQTDLRAAREWIATAPLYHAPGCVLAGQAVATTGPNPDYACSCPVGPAQVRRRELLGGNEGE